MKKNNIDLRRRGNDLIDPKQNNFRLDPVDADEFRRFSKEDGISQAEEFRYLIYLRQSLNNDRVVSEKIQYHSQLKNQIASLKHALRKIRTENSGLKKLLKKFNQGRELMARARMGIECCCFFTRALCQSGVLKKAGAPSEVLSFREGQRRGSYQYTYPAEGAIEALTLEFMCYDGTSVLCHFLNERAEKVKLHMWPKNHFQPLCGTTSFVRGVFSTVGSRWLCAYGKMHHGYIELVCAIPMPDWLLPTQEPIVEDRPLSALSNTSSLQSLISDAKARKSS